jgi:branched-chain amino acid transport system substrate-binding protein
VWAINPDQTVSRIDPQTNRRVATIKAVTAVNVAADEQRAWVVERNAVAAIDAKTNKVVKRVEIAADSLTTIAVGGGAVWIADPLGGSVWRVDPDPEPRLRQIPLDLGVRGVAFGRGAAWVTNEIADKVQRIDPRTNRAHLVSRVIGPQQVAVGPSGVWVTALGRQVGGWTLPQPSWGGVIAGSAAAELIIASDLPLKRPTRNWTAPMTQAIRFVLERRGFKAGRHTVGYQSCDNATAQAGGADFYRCFSNAKAFARTAPVVGVIGAYESFCSAMEIPVLNQAPGGPVAMISPSNTINDLTRPLPGAPPSELRKLYPSGRRNDVRMAATDHAAVIALVAAARQLQLRRLFVLADGEDSDSLRNAAQIRAGTRSAGLAVVGAGRWGPGARSFAGLARKVAARRPDGVFLLGAAPRRPGVLLRDLRARLGRDVALIASDGFSGVERLPGVARKSATGLYVGNYGVPNAKLPAEGRRFLKEFEKRHGHGAPDLSAAYGAQAAEVLLDAIARSDGTRASVTRELRRTNVKNGILGAISFDRYGDLVEAPLTLSRITSTGVVVDRVITVRAG